MVAMAAAKLMVLRQHRSTPFLLSSLPRLLSRSSLSSSSAAISPKPPLLPISAVAITHGPSLRKSTPIPPTTTTTTDDDDVTSFDEDHFTRVHDISALRVPAEHCYALENRLRGHLLNWPRIRNVARSPGDEIEEEMRDLILNEGCGGGEEAAASRRINGRAEGDGEELSGVLYRDRLVKEFNSRGFVRFRNLAKISRPKRKVKKRKEEESGRERRESVELEVVEEEEEEGGDLSGLLGEEFKGRRWRWSTRLLLLDEKYSGKEVDELPEAVKAVLRGDGKEDAEIAFELVRCKLTLFYDYWSMNEVLEALLPQGMIVPTAFETVGHIAHLNLREEHLPYKKLIAKVVLDKNRPKMRTVVNKLEAISNDYRTMQLQVLAGNRSLVTTVNENGIKFQVDLAAVYWSSRLGTERQRLMSCFKYDDVVCDVFSGVGPIAIAAAKTVKHVYANDLNPIAVDYLERNSVLNRLERKIEVYNMDGRRFIDTIFSSEKAHSVTQVVMNLPNDAAEYLDAFRGIFQNKPRDTTVKLPWIHVYGFSKADDPEFDFHERIRIGLSEVAVAVEMRRVRLVAPGKWMLCASFVLPESVAYGRSSKTCK